MGVNGSAAVEIKNVVLGKPWSPGSRAGLGGGRRKLMPGRVFIARWKPHSTLWVPWEKCIHEDRGDGVLVLIPGQLSKVPFATSLPLELAHALKEHNDVLPENERIQLRVAVHAGEVAD